LRDATSTRAAAEHEPADSRSALKSGTVTNPV
jgi:hypothetical protein